MGEFFVIRFVIFFVRGVELMVHHVDIVGRWVPITPGFIRAFSSEVSSFIAMKASPIVVFGSDKGSCPTWVSSCLVAISLVSIMAVVAPILVLILALPSRLSLITMLAVSGVQLITAMVTMEGLDLMVFSGVIVSRA